MPTNNPRLVQRCGMSNYYNEFDPKAAAWLKQLIVDGHIPKGEVDERSITEVRPADLDGFRQCHFFAGIAGWSRALQLAGVDPDFPLWTGSCPCPPFSCAGKKKSCPQCSARSLLPHPFRTGVFACCECGHEWSADHRHLWPEFYRLIKEHRPPIIFGEQVAGPDGEIWLAGVRACLEIEGYGVGASDLCSASVGAPNIRQRLYWLAESRCSSDELRGRSRAPLAAPGETQGETQQRERSGNATGDGRTDGGLAVAGGEQVDASAALRLHADTRGRCGESDFKLGQPDGIGCEQRRESTAPARHGSSVEPASWDGVDRLGDTDAKGLEERPQSEGNLTMGNEGATVVAPGLGGGFWDDWRIVHFTDGKTRRLKPGIEPLAPRISGDLDLLRAYGNSINPYVAKEFVCACFEALEHLKTEIR